MISRFLTLGKLPELRLEPQSADAEHPVPELEVALQIDDYWELCELLREFRYAKETGQATKKIWQRVAKIISFSIISERDRIWFIKQKI